MLFRSLLGQGAVLNMYYYKAWPLLFTPIDDEVISTTGTVGSISGASSPWTATISGMTTTTGFEVGMEISATAGSGSLGGGAGTYTVASIPSSTSITFTATGGTTPTVGSVTNVSIINQDVQSNAVLQSWPEGYVYGTLQEYYIKRHNDQDAAVYKAKFDDAWKQVENQNNLGKWSGGHTRMTSIFQPRTWRQYAVK